MADRRRDKTFQLTLNKHKSKSCRSSNTASAVTKGLGY